MSEQSGVNKTGGVEQPESESAPVERLVLTSESLRVLNKIYLNVRMLRILFQASRGGTFAEMAQLELKKLQASDCDF